MKQQGELYQNRGEIANRSRWGRLSRLLGGALLFLVLALLAYYRWGRPAGPSYVTVRRGALSGTVIASGEVVADRQAQLSSRVGGRVSVVPVEVGDAIISGTLLIAIEAESLGYRVEQARLRLEIARLRLAGLQERARPEEIALAQAELELAQSRLATLEAGAGSEDVTILQQEVVQAQAALDQARESGAVSVETARLNWETAANALRDVQAAYSRIYWDNDRLRQRGIELSQAQQDAESSAWRRVEDAEAAMKQARLAYERALQEKQAGVTVAEARLTQARVRLQELLSGPTAAELAQAQAQVAQAESSLSQVETGPAERDVQIAQQELRLAELVMEEAQSDLAKATILAPFDATVVGVEVEEGELVGLYSALVRLADLNQLQIQARIDEIDVGQVAPGQVVTITLDAFPGRPLRGYVEEVAPAVTVDRGSAVYLSTIAFSNSPSLTLRLGMAASLLVVTLEKDDVLLLPRETVEHVGSGDYVTVLRGRHRERVRVTLGLADARYYEVLEGVEEGDQVLLP